MPNNMFTYETNVKKLMLLDCQNISDGKLAAKSFCNVIEIQDLKLPTNLKEIKDGVWNNNVLITNCYYEKPLAYWGFEVTFDSLLENPMDRIISFYSKETMTAYQKNRDDLSFFDYWNNKGKPEKLVINPCAYYGNWFINSIDFNYITQIKEKAFDKNRALREIFTSDAGGIYYLYSNGLPKSQFQSYVNTKISGDTQTLGNTGGNNSGTDN